MRRFFRRHGLSVTMLGGFFLLFFIGQVSAGLKEYNVEREKNGQTPVSYTDYLTSAHFGEATAENWESEFLQMCIYVLATAYLYQKGSAESHDPDGKHRERVPRPKPNSPWPVRRGGWALRFYRHSLSITLFGLFLLSFVWHAVAGQRLFNEERLADGELPLELGQFLASSRFWFQAFQNWQSEFLSIGAMVLLTIWLREANSPESKKVETPHWENEE